MKFGVREICDVVLRAKAKQKLGSKTFYRGEPVLKFDSLKTSTLEGAATTVYATGGRGNSRLIAWEGEKTMTFTFEDALLSTESFSILSGANLTENSAEKPAYVHQTSKCEVKNGCVTLKNVNLAYDYQSNVKITNTNLTKEEIKELRNNYHDSANIYCMKMANSVLEPEIPYLVMFHGNDVDIYSQSMEDGDVFLVDYYIQKGGPDVFIWKGTYEETQEGPDPWELNVGSIMPFDDNLFDLFVLNSNCSIKIHYMPPKNNIDKEEKHFNVQNAHFNLIVTTKDNQYCPVDKIVLRRLENRVETDESEWHNSIGFAFCDMSWKNINTNEIYIYDDEHEEFWLSFMEDLESGYVVEIENYIENKSGTVKTIEITPDKFAGNYYLEAKTLFRREGDGVDMPAEFVIPNGKIQSNFNFTMASSGDPSTFTFTMDAFPDYTKFDHKKKVLAAIQIMEDNVTTNGSDARAACAAPAANEPEPEPIMEETEPELEENEDV